MSDLQKSASLITTGRWHFVAEIPADTTSGGDIIAVGRLIKHPFQSQAELAVLVSDHYQRRGICAALTRRLIDFAKDENLSLLIAAVLTENKPMQKLLENYGFVFDGELDDDVVEGKLRIRKGCFN